MWCPGSDVVHDCIDSGSLPSYSLCDGPSSNYSNEVSGHLQQLSLAKECLNGFLQLTVLSHFIGFWLMTYLLVLKYMLYILLLMLADCLNETSFFSAPPTKTWIQL